MSWVKIIDEKFHQDYRGSAQLQEWTFTVPLGEQVGAQYLADKMIAGHEEELQKQGCFLLELRVWQDTTPTWETKYFVRSVATTDTNYGGVSAIPLIWGVVIVGVLALLFIVGLSYVLGKTEDIVEYLGDNAPYTLAAIPIVAIAAAGAVFVAGYYLVNKNRAGRKYGD
ncbi:MAG: hypothetical protein WC359_13650 [Dehalococcoidia bacterium]|jgi:hypothetical protein